MKLNVSSAIQNKVILITGGTGSFGTTVTKRLLGYKPKRIIIFSRDEKKQHDMREEFNSPLLKFVIGDTRNYESIYDIMAGVDYVFHAAALKQVPSCEFFPMEAVYTNILGAHNVIRASMAHDVKRVVVLSTDKAAYPINVMGMSKAIMEKVMIAQSKNLIERKGKTVLCGVRYGNVLYSRGSVLPYFIDLIKNNKKITITNYNMTRFLLPLPEAVDLVLYALTKGENGYLYVRKSGACTLETMAKAICKIFKYDIGYTEVGIRAGEKMHETLLTQEELIRAQDIGDYYSIPPESQGLDYNRYFYRGKKKDVSKLAAYTSENTYRLSLSDTIDLFSSLPEIKSELKNKRRE